MTPQIPPETLKSGPEHALKNRKWVLFLATGLSLGYIPRAPGTWGSLLGIPLAWVLSLGPMACEILGLALFAMGAVWIAGQAGILLGKTDAAQIVVDEVIGMAVALWGATLSPACIITTFLLFRLFDIWKPFPIRNAEKAVPGGWGVVLDDVLAGGMANVSWRLGVLVVNHVR